MEIFFTILFVLFLFPIVLIVSAYKLIKAKRNWVKLISIIPTGIFLTLSFFIYDAIFPAEDFYIERWKENTAIDFPESANIIHKSATFPDNHGSYTASMVFELAKQEYQLLLSEVEKSHTKEQGNCDMSLSSVPYDLYPTNRTCYSLRIKKPITISFLNDEKSVVFQKFH